MTDGDRRWLARVLKHVPELTRGVAVAVFDESGYHHSYLADEP